MVDLPPPAYGLHVVGRDKDGQRGAKQRDWLEEIGLTPSSRLLEIGCGVGRLAYELRDYFDGGTYTGFDVSRSAIEWLNSNYAPLRPQYRFDFVDVYNPRFHPAGGLSSDAVPFPYDDASFDLVCAFEVFMHMDKEGVEHYLDEVRRVLVPAGRALVTFMAIYDDSAPGRHAGRDFVALGDGVYSRFPDREGWSLGYHDDLIRRMLGAADLSVDRRVEGRWHDPWGEPAAEGLEHGCDVYIVSRPA